MTTAVLPPPTRTNAPQRIPMSYEAYLAFATEHQLIEWANGEAIIMPTPFLDHQNLLLFLAELLREFVRQFQLGHVLIAPFEVKLWTNGPARQPDLLFVSREQADQLSQRRFTGAPALVVEVVSPSSAVEDRQNKFVEYQQAGVREYWIVDSRPYQEQAEFFVLNDEGVYQAAELDEEGRFFSTILPHFWLNVQWLKQAELPNPQHKAAEILRSVPTLPEPVRHAYQVLFEALGD